MANYHDIAADLRSKINHGFYEEEKKLPKQSELAADYQTSRVTIQKALNILQMEGIIYGKKARVPLSATPIQPSITTPRSIAG